MTTNPFFNALIAVLYISFLVTMVNFGSKWAEQQAADNLLLPIGMLSVFVTSVAFMAYTFFYQPVIMFLDGKRKEGVRLFLQSLGIFAVITAIVLISALVMFK